MEILQPITNRILLAYLLTTELGYTIEDGYIKSNVSLLIDDEYINNEESKISQIIEIEERNKIEEIIYTLKKNLNNGNNL